jgi:hypothetical protein
MVFIWEKAAETPSRMHSSDVDVFFILVYVIVVEVDQSCFSLEITAANPPAAESFTGRTVAAFTG